MAKAKTSTNDDATKTHPDRKLISVCVEYGFAMGGCGKAYSIDPTDGTFAAPIDSHHLMRGYGLLAKGARLKATTLDGLAAKASVAEMLCSTGVLDRIGEDEAPFIRSLVADVRRFHELAGGKHDDAPTHKVFGGTA